MVIRLEVDRAASKESETNVDGLAAITGCNGIAAVVALMSDRNATPLAKENAAAALLHLASDPDSRDLIAHSGGIAPLVGLLKDGTHMAHRHASDALARLANQGREHQAQIAKKLASLLMPENTTTVQQRAAHALQMLAVDNPGSQTVIVNAGVISPLVHLLSTAQDPDVKKAAEDALGTLVVGHGNNVSAITDLVALLGTGSLKAQELVARLLLILCEGAENRKAIAKSSAMMKLMSQLSSQSAKVQEAAGAVLSALSSDAPENVTKIAKNGGI